MNRLLLCCLALLLGCGLTWAPAAQADVTCQAAIQAGSINFGNVDPSQAQNVDVTATISYNCSNTDKQSQQLTLCFNIDSDGATTGGNRQMAGTAASTLQFQLYRDAARTQVAGSIYASGASQPVRAQVSVPKSRGNGPGMYTGTVNVYGRVFGSQSSPVGSYSANFAPKLTGAVGWVGCNNTYDDGISMMSPFTVMANVPPACSTAAASDLDFGQSTGFLAANMDQTSTIDIACVNGTPYQVGLDQGINADGNGRRMLLSGGGDYVAYNLYRDPARSQTWGNAQNTDTIAGTSTGLSRQLTVYGRVPQQATPTPGNYTDTITVYVYY